MYSSVSQSLAHRANLAASVQIVTEAGATYLEAPVSGSKAPAEQGTLIFLCGGDEALFERSAALLDVMGKAKLFLGKVGASLSSRSTTSSQM